MTEDLVYLPDASFPSSSMLYDKPGFNKSLENFEVFSIVCINLYYSAIYIFQPIKQLVTM